MNSPTARFLSALALFAAWTSLVGCGAGGAGRSAGAIDPTGPVTVQGKVVEVDGVTQGLGGVPLRILPEGRSVQTSADGSFTFGQVDERAFEIRLGLATGFRSSKGGDDDGPDDDEDGPGDDDGLEADDDEPDDDDAPDQDEDELEDDDFEDGDFEDDRVRVTRTAAGERIDVRLRIRDGRIVQVSSTRTHRSEREARASLTRTPAAATNLRGKVDIESRDDRERFKVEVEHATPGTRFELVVIDASGLEESQGLRTADAFGEAEWKLDSRKGAVLPFAVASVEALEDFGVEIRDADGVVLLRGTVPALPAASAAGGDDEDDDGESRLRGRARLAPTEPGLEGYVEVRSRPEKGRERFKIEAEHLAPGRRVEFFVEDSVASGVFTSYGTLAADVEGEAELKLRTEDGQALPAGATRVTELTGLRVEVRDPTDGTVLLAGTVPQPLID